ncbi:MAG: hypothetical protein JXA69_13990 [Phycisphaerae bacterium]|nr:hypothetical protein [Phycisphaerae bacterium]
MVRVQCPHCQRRYRTQISAFGMTAVCSKCFETFKIGESRPPFEFEPKPGLAEDSWIGVEVPKEEAVLPHCAFCDAAMEPGSAVCLECGRNQVTGVVQKISAPQPEEAVAWWHLVPVRPLLVGLAVVILVGGAYWLFRSFAMSAAGMGDALADEALVLQVARQIRAGEDPDTLARQYAGEVTDANLMRFVERLEARDQAVREALVILIGSGAATQLEPVLALEATPDKAAIVRAALEAIGARRLVALACHDDPLVRASAAKALCVRFGLSRDDKTIGSLAEAVPIAEKTATLNELCGRWPRATGEFVVIIGETVSPFVVVIEQAGRTFYLRAGAAEFVSLASERPAFEIRVPAWCAATGAGGGEAILAATVAGSIRLQPASQLGWEGTARVVARRDCSDALLGFLPVGAIKSGDQLELPVRLERP